MRLRKRKTQLAVDKIHNVWHPQIVNDIHQQGAYGSRLFLPPYLKPVEPNVPKQIVAGYTELGNFMAQDLRAKGFQGITTDSTYDAWTPARAYSHYHGGVRILSETASAKLATPITVKFDQLRGGLGYDAKTDSPNFSPVWKGGEWHLRDITNYMTAAAFSLLKHAANNRREWLSRFYAIGKEAVRPRRDGELYGFIFDATSSGGEKLGAIFELARVKVDETDDGSLVKMAQPYGGFAKALLENQSYPNLKDEKGNPIPPYDVTAHTLSLLYGAEAKSVQAPYKVKKPTWGRSGSDYGHCKNVFDKNAIYKSHIPAIDEGWTRWAFEDIKKRECIDYSSLQDQEIKQGDFREKFNLIIFPDQSPNQILSGYAKGSMPDEYTGGVGKEGVENLKKFVEAGGTLVFLNRASDFAIEQFNLPVRDVTKNLPEKDFYIPGSILRTEIDTTSPIAEGMPAKSIAWFEDSPAFEITDNANVKIIAKYPDNPKDILLSGYILGAEKIAGKAALVEVKMGKGKIILFGFRPQYRGQSLATFPLLFNAISN